jgi:hypothetical protein
MAFPEAIGRGKANRASIPQAFSSRASVAVTVVGGAAKSYRRMRVFVSGLEAFSDERLST